MSIIGQYYKYFASETYREEFASIIYDSANYITRKIIEYWAPKKQSGGVDLSELPGELFGFEPMEIQFLFQKKTTKKSAPTTVLSTTMLSDQRDSATIDKEFIEKMWEKYPSLKACTPDMILPEVIAHAHGIIPSPITTDIYAVAPANKRTSNWFPVMFHRELGEVYYTNFSCYKAYQTGKLVITGEYDGYDNRTVFAVNWITGKSYFIGRPVEGFIPEKLPWYGAKSWDQGDIEAKWEERCTRYREYGPFPETPTLRQLPVTVMDSEEAERLHEQNEKAREEWAIRRDPSHPWIERRNFSSSADCMSLPHVHSNTGDAVCNSFLEHIYELPKGSLEMSIYNQMMTIRYQRSMDGILTTMRYMGNLFQSVLQTAQVNDWFLRSLMCSLRNGGQPLTKTEPDVKSIANWLGLTKPDYNALMAEPNEGKLVFMLLMNQIKPTSYKEFERCYQKLQELHTLWLKEFDSVPKHKYHIASILWQKQAKLKNRRGRILFETTRLPQAMAYYTKNNLKRVCTPLQYIKYIIDEGKKSADETGNCKTLQQMEKLLTDYNRMAKEIAPKAPFALPHNLCAAHDTMVRNYNKISKEKAASAYSEYTEFARCYAGKIANVCEDPKFTVVAPGSSEDLYEEGILLNHCVGSYGADIIKAKGSMLIYFLRLKTKPSNPLVTIQVDKEVDGSYGLTEIAGKGNRLPTEEEAAFAKKWLHAFNEKIKESIKAKDEPTTDFDTETRNWLVVMGITLAFMPAYNAACTKEENYLKLFSFVAECVEEMLARKVLPLTKKEFLKKVYTECGRLKLSTAATLVITTRFEGMLKATAAA